MTYRELFERKILLCGPEKICRDLEEFFYELQIAESLYMEKTEGILQKEDENKVLTWLNQWKGKGFFIMGFTDSSYIISTILEQNHMRHGDDYIWVDDLLEITDEMETFYIDKRKAGRKIAVYGTDKLVNDLISKNPSLQIDYMVMENDKESNVKGYSIVSLDELILVDKSELFVVLATEIDSQIKQKFLDLGLIFGENFHFYNPRVPKHTTSYYLKKTIYDVPKYSLPCDYTARALSIKSHGNVMACCSALTLSLGNCKFTSIEEILAGIQAQVVNLSVNNRTYSFCGEMCFWFREKAYCLSDEEEISKNVRRHDKLHTIPEFNVQLGYDRSCNLACPSCRTHRITKPEDEPEIVEMIHTEVKNMCLKKPRNMRIGNGELFFSKYYKDIIFNCYESKKIALISNGILFNEENWSKLELRYEKIALEVSMDATKANTYQKLRGGNFDILLRNMDFAGQLRRENRLEKLSISFVIQVENFREMVAFVEYGNRIHADYIHFMKLNSWGHIPTEEFVKMDVYDSRNPNHAEFVEILHNPVFMNPNVHVDNINNFL